MTSETFFATCAPGVEPALHAELLALKLAHTERRRGGVSFRGSLHDAWRANLWLRTAIRVLLGVGQFEARDGDELYAGARHVDWSRFLEPTGTLRVSARSGESELDNTMFVAQRVKDAVADQFREASGERPSVDKEGADLEIYVHLHRNRCRLHVDTSGASLHKRGWRRFQGRAPLAESTAAAVLQLIGWDGRAPLIDPFCGSATILVEAALAAGGFAPGLFREQFGFERWRGHDARRWGKLREQARASAALPRKLRLVGFDRDPDALAGARENIEAAGVADVVELEQADAREIAPRPGWNAWIVTNPPYGERIGRAASLGSLYEAFGARLRQACDGYYLGLLCADDALVERLAIAFDEPVRLVHGGLECGLWTTRLEARDAEARGVARRLQS